MARLSWTRTVESWRTIDPARQARIRRARLVLNVAESMACAGTPVDVKMLDAALQRLGLSPSTPASDG